MGGSTGSRLIELEKGIGSIIDKYLLEVDPVSVREAEKKEIYATQLDISEGNFPYQDRSFDVVTLCWALEHMQPQKRGNVIREIHRVLKDGGRFYFGDDLYSKIPWEEEHFNRVYKPKGYGLGTFFLGIFEPTGLPSSDPKKVQESKHPASDRDMAYKLVAGPMFGKVFLLDELRQLVQDFNLDDIILTEIDNLENAGKIIARGTLEIEKNQNNGGAFLASLRK